jgi:hypothetical protein
MHLFPEASERRGGYLRRGCRIERHDAERCKEGDLLWYELPIQEIPDEGDAETFMIAVIMMAMQERRTLRVHGTISRQLLGNLTEYRDAWCLWLPQTYHPIEFEVDHVEEDGPLRPGAVCAFSGGLDGTFSIWRHARGLAGHRSQTIVHGVMIHGFDIPLDDQEGFSVAFERGALTLRSLGVPLRPLRTNFREVVRTNWEDVHGTALVAALGCFKASVGTGIVGSGWYYRNLLPPSETERHGAWGSNPVTDHLLSGGAFRILHDGADHTRREKIRALTAWPEGSNNLRVCWAGSDKGRNCGRCEKCVRTMLAFRLNDLSIPDCFPRVAPLHQLVREVKVTRWWHRLVEEADTRGVREPWVGALRFVLRRHAIRRRIRETVDILLPPGSRRREWAKMLAVDGTGT